MKREYRKGEQGVLQGNTSEKIKKHEWSTAWQSSWTSKLATSLRAMPPGWVLLYLEVPSLEKK